MSLHPSGWSCVNWSHFPYVVNYTALCAVFHASSVFGFLVLVFGKLSAGAASRMQQQWVDIFGIGVGWRMERSPSLSFDKFSFREVFCVLPK